MYTSKYYYLLYVFVSLLIVNTISAKSSPRASIDDVAEFLQQIKNETKEARDSALKGMDEYQEHINAIALFALVNGTKILDQEASTFVQALEQIKSEAAELELDISECLADKEDTIYHLKQTGISMLQESINDMFEAVNHIVNGGKTQIMNMYKIVLNIERIFNMCDQDDQGCLDEVIYLLQEYDLPTLIQNDLQSANYTVKYLSNLIFDCENSSAYSIQDTGYELIFAITDCIANLQTFHNN